MKLHIRGLLGLLGSTRTKAASSEKALRQYKAAIVADGETMSRELARQQAAENLALAAQQKAKTLVLMKIERARTSL